MFGFLLYLEEAIDDNIITLNEGNRIQAQQLELWQEGLLEGALFGILLGSLLGLSIGYGINDIAGFVVFLLITIIGMYMGTLYGPLISKRKSHDH
jgi:hypothetical protein